jgi:hypothetical protein
VKNLRKSWNEYEQAKHRYEIRIAQEKRTQERKAQSQDAAEQARPGIQQVDTEKGRAA